MPSDRQTWTEQETQYLRENWLTLPLKELSLRLDCSWKTARNQARKLGLPDKQTAWSAAQDQYLREYWGNLTALEIARYLGRTTAAIYNRVKTLKLPDPMAEKRWTEADKQYLRDHWASQTATAIGEHLGRKANSVEAQVNRLGLRGVSKQQELNWTAEQTQFLLDHGQTMPYAEIAAHLGRSVAAVRGKAHGLGLVLKGGWSEQETQHLRHYWGDKTARELADELGKSVPSIIKKRKQLCLTKTPKQVQAASYRTLLSPKFVALCLSNKNPEQAQELLNYPQLIELKKTQLELNRVLRDERG